MMSEIVQIQLELSTREENQNIAKTVEVARLAIRSQPHHLPLLAILAKAQILRRRGIKEAEAVRVLDPVPHLQAPTLAPTNHGAHKIAEAVNREQSRPFERRDEECARHVRLMVLHIVEHGAQFCVGYF